MRRLVTTALLFCSLALVAMAAPAPKPRAKPAPPVRWEGTWVLGSYRVRLTASGGYEARLLPGSFGETWETYVGWWEPAGPRRIRVREWHAGQPTPWYPWEGPCGIYTFRAERPGVLVTE